MVSRWSIFTVVSLYLAFFCDPYPSRTRNTSFIYGIAKVNKYMFLVNIVV